MQTTITEVGSFKIESGKVIVSDPCYKLGTWCQGTIENIKNGTWITYKEEMDAGVWGERVSRLFALHESTEQDGYQKEWEEQEFDVGVDSGQAGIFDSNVYQNDNTAPKKDKHYIEDEIWYSSCCDVTLTPQSAGVINGGCVSSSGYGDGSYGCFISNENGVVTGIMIDYYVGEEDEEENEEALSDLKEFEDESKSREKEIKEDMKELGRALGIE